MSIKQQIWTVFVFTKLGTRRFLRDSQALFFGIMLPLIFLFVLGSLSGNNNVSFKVALVDNSHSAFATQFTVQLKHQKIFKIDPQANTLALAKEKISRGQLDGIIVLPKDFGTVKTGQTYPSGQAELLYNKSSSGTGETLNSALQGVFKGVNAKFVSTQLPFSVVGKELNAKSLTSFDYTFAGLLGFSIMGIGVFGPSNVFPELKKQGVLRRLRITPIKTWQYFLATMFSQAATGIISLLLQFIVAIEIFHLKVVGNYFEILLFSVFGIFTLLGLGLAIGGWAKNERQAQPLVNIIAFPMLFLSGTFFPRFLMPEWLQNFTTYLPLTPVIDGLRLLITEGKHLVDIGPQIAVVGVWFIFIYAVAFRVFKWE